MTESYAGFLDMINEAYEIVERDYPTAQFFDAALDLGRPGSGWCFVYNVPPTDPKGLHTTVFLHNYMGRFELPPKHIHERCFEDRAIPLPIKLGLEEAVTPAKKAGYSAPIIYINLRWVLHPGVDEPHYIFAMPSDNVRVFVGVYTHKVTASPLTD